MNESHRTKVEVFVGKKEENYQTKTAKLYKEVTKVFRGFYTCWRGSHWVPSMQGFPYFHTGKPFFFFFCYFWNYREAILLNILQKYVIFHFFGYMEHCFATDGVTRRVKHLLAFLYLLPLMNHQWSCYGVSSAKGGFEKRAGGSGCCWGAKGEKTLKDTCSRGCLGGKENEAEWIICYSENCRQIVEPQLYHVVSGAVASFFLC